MIPALVILLTLLPTLAAACPACVGQQDSFTNTLKALSIMILVPFVIVYFVIRAVRREIGR